MPNIRSMGASSAGACLQSTQSNQEAGVRSSRKPLEAWQEVPQGGAVVARRATAPIRRALEGTCHGGVGLVTYVRLRSLL